MVLAFLISLAIISYAPSDFQLARTFSLDAALSPGDNRASNALGFVGAVLARGLVPLFLGYTSLLLTSLLGVWGYVILRHRPAPNLRLISFLTVIGTLVLAAFIGWFGFSAEQDLSLWSGAVGQGVAGWMRQVFGAVGAFVLLLLMLVVTVLLVIDHDIQRSIDRLEDAVASAKFRFQDWRADWKTRSEERRSAKEKRLAERQKIREQAKREREKKLKTAQSRATRKTEAVSSTKSPARTESPRAPHHTARLRDTPMGDPPPTRNDLFRAQPPVAAPEQTPPPPASRPSTDDPTDLKLKVQERVQEEKAHNIKRENEVVDREVPYVFPSIDLLDDSDEQGLDIDYDELEENKRVLLEKLATYNVEIVDINAIVGPTVTLYELTPAAGVKISRITALENDLAMAMAARGIRIIAPIPGKSAVGVEIPNRHRELVLIRDILGTAKFRDTQMELPIALGKSIEGEVFLEDLSKMPHLLVAGATGSGKSVGINALIAGLLYACHPSNLKFVLIDPKKIELQQYKEIIAHYIAMPEGAEDAIITDFNDALGVLRSCEKEMERRYDLLSKASVRGIKEYNKKLQHGKLSPADEHQHLPYIVVIIDELADLMMTAGKEIEGPIARLAQMARAVGIHLVLATQRPSVDVITGLIKANFPSRVAYQVASKIDARTILDQNGAEGLVGNGDMLYMKGSRLIRLQGPFVSIDEVDRLTEFIAAQQGRGPYMLPAADDDSSPLADSLGVEELDELFQEAARIIVQSQQGSVSLLQRKLSVGYTRAARIVDQLEEAGIVGPFVGSKARDVLVSDLQALEDFLQAREE